MDNSFRETEKPNVYLDLEGSGKFRFEVVDSQGGFPITDTDHGTVTGGGIAPKHLDGKMIKFTYGDNESMVIEFTKETAFEMYSETERSDAMSYDADTEGNTVTVTLFGDRADDIYTLNFTTARTGDGRLDDYEYLQPNEVDNSFRETEKPNIYLDLEGSGKFRFEVVDPQGGFPITDTGRGNDDGHHQDGEHEFVKLEDVKTFVDSALSEFGERLKK